MKPWSTLLCDDEELSFLKRAFESINQATQDAKREHDFADRQKVRVKMPHTTREFEEYGKEHEGW